MQTEDCFLHGAFAQAATILASTTSVQVGMGDDPVARHRDLFRSTAPATTSRVQRGRDGSVGMNTSAASHHQVTARPGRWRRG
jgi:hypothetical protein